jgi:hypothetical protein
MTDMISSSPTAVPDLAPPPAPPLPADDQSTVDSAKQQASAVGQSAADAGQHVAGVAKEQAQNVAGEAGTQAKDLFDQARSELSTQAGAQQQRLAAGLRALGDELHAMTQHEADPGVATGLARKGATRSHDLAEWLDDREPGSLVEELKGFARQRPAAFLGLAAGAGLLAGRLTRGVKDASADSGDESPGSTAPRGDIEPSPVAQVAPVEVPVEPPALATAPGWTPPPPDRGLGLGAGI